MTLIVAPLRYVTDLIARRQPSHVLTLLAPEVQLPDCAGIAPSNRLALRFNDIAAPMAGYIAPDAQTINDILGFGSAWAPHAPMLIHCFAGISRSTAAAYILACKHLGAGCEDELAQRLRAAAPSATPNRLMISLADGILGRGGRMIAAVEAIGRGAEAFEGEPFDLALDR